MHSADVSLQHCVCSEAARQQEVEDTPFLGFVCCELLEPPSLGSRSCVALLGQFLLHLIFGFGLGFVLGLVIGVPLVS